MPHPHGTINRYNNQKCRCDACRAAIRDYRRSQRAKTARQREEVSREANAPGVPVDLAYALRRFIDSRTAPMPVVVESRCGRCGSTAGTYVSQGLRWCVICRGVRGTE
jgi:hypothetical protein